jgi:hypothetical protein
VHGFEAGPEVSGPSEMRPSKRRLSMAFSARKHVMRKKQDLVSHDKTGAVKAPQKIPSFLDKEVLDARVYCDLCFMPRKMGEVKQTEDYVTLCHSCMAKLESLPEGEIKDSFKRILLCNFI